MNIAVMGAGAIGCFIGGMLSAAGHAVTLIGRPRLMNKIQQDGLTIRRPGKPDLLTRPQTCTTVPDRGPFEVIFVTVKMPALPAAADELAGLLEKSAARLVAMQNGVGAEEHLTGRFGAERVVAGTITIPIQVPESGLIEVSKDKGGLGLAAMSAGQSGFVRQLAGTLTQAGLPTRIYPDYRAMKWSKLLLNIVTNASSAILDEPPARIVAHPELFNLEIEALAEGVSVMKAQGIGAVSLPGYPVEWLARLVSAPYLPLSLKRAILRPAMQSGRGSKMPSLHIDLAAGRTTTEIDALNGAIVRAGQSLGLPTPANSTLVEIFHQLASGKTERQAYRGRPDKLLAYRRRFRGPAAPESNHSSPTPGTSL
ncbi:MAG: ketopantoate reductase family protein [Chloroflexi bacterium]|nr:MAG: ketopantoate reductase family protein [Chloroflexota bacterium]